MKSLFSGKVLLPLVTASVGAAWKLLEPRMKELNPGARRLRALDHATKRLKFWELWLKALEASGSATDEEKAAAGAEFKAAADLVRQVFNETRDVRELPVAEFLKYKKRLNRMRRFLMLYREPSEAASRWRWWAYLFSVAMVGEAYGLDHSSLIKGFREGLSGIWPATVLRYALYVVPPVAMWRKARQMFEKREGEYLAARLKEEGLRGFDGLGQDGKKADPRG